MRTLFIIFSILAIQSTIVQAEPTEKVLTVDQVETKILSGSLGQHFAERAKKSGEIHIKEIPDTGIPYKVFTFDDYMAGYSVLVYQGKLILLCSGFGGGYAHDFAIKNENDREVLSYRFEIGSGVTYEMLGRYVIGAQKAEWQKLKYASKKNQNIRLRTDGKHPEGISAVFCCTSDTGNHPVQSIRFRGNRQHSRGTEFTGRKSLKLTVDNLMKLVTRNAAEKYES